MARKLGNAGIVWTVHPDVLASNIERYGDIVLASLMHELEGVARQIEAFAKANHPWQNQTGAAEAGLTCEVFQGGGGLQIVLYHQAPHGFWLEVKYAGRWGIIPLAMETHYDAIMQAARAAL